MTVFNVNLFADIPNDGVLDDGVVDLDPDTPGDQISLRAAIQEANATPGDDVINLPAGTYELTIAVDPDPPDDRHGDLDVTSGKLTINGVDAASTIIDGNQIDRVFEVYAGAELDIGGVTITGGRASGDGGGIYNEGSLLVRDSVLAENSSFYGGGGAIFSDGILLIRDSTLSDNRAEFDAGGAVVGLPRSMYQRE